MRGGATTAIHPILEATSTRRGPRYSGWCISPRLQLTHLHVGGATRSCAMAAASTTTSSSSRGAVVPMLTLGVSVPLHFTRPGLALFTESFSLERGRRPLRRGATVERITTCGRCPSLTYQRRGLRRVASCMLFLLNCERINSRLGSPSLADALAPAPAPLSLHCCCCGPHYGHLPANTHVLRLAGPGESLLLGH